MKPYTLSFCLGFFIAFSPTLLAQSAPDTVILRFKSVPQALNYMTTYYRQTTNIINESDDTGKSQTFKNDTYEYSEAMKEQKQEGNSTAMWFGNKISFLKKENDTTSLNSIKPVQLENEMESSGRLNAPFRMDDLAYLGIPILFPTGNIAPNQDWEGSFDFKDADLPSLNLQQKFSFKKIITIGSRKLAQIDYTVQTQMRATDHSDDSIVQQKILALKANHIESVHYDGKGSLTFDFVNGHIHTHTLTLTQQVSKAFIADNKRTLQETTVSYEFAEALLP